MAARVIQRRRDKPAQPETHGAQAVLQRIRRAFVSDLGAYLCMTEQVYSAVAWHGVDTQCTTLQLMGHRPNVHHDQLSQGKMRRRCML